MTIHVAICYAKSPDVPTAEHTFISPCCRYIIAEVPSQMLVCGQRSNCNGQQEVLRSAQLF
jgi:hypothetical protein